MGLSTSFGIIGRHGGEISVRSSEGKGTVFTVKLPSASEPERKTGPEKETAFEFKARFLVIDDQPLLIDLMEKALKRYGQTVFKAESGQEGINIFQQKEIDMVICDLGMPNMNGWQVARAIKNICKKKGASRPPFILLTGWAGQLEDQKKILKVGVDRIVEKPIKYPLLFNVVRELLEINGNKGS
jgi:CheY-like chemotaxis protein